jgi:uncharacterized membrane protein YhaH (DUF805 family)
MFGKRGERLFALILRLLHWYADRVKTSWSREFRRLKKRDDKWIWIVLCLFISVILTPYLGGMAFHLSLLLGLSFVWSAFWAVSFGRILRNPLWLALVFVAVVLGDEAINLFKAAEDAAIAANVIGAAILITVGLYLMAWADQLEKDGV